MANRKNWFDKKGAKDKYSTEGDCRELEFSHGIETEYFLVDNEGDKLTHAEFGEVYNEIISEEWIDTLREKIPRFYGKKIISLTIAPSKSSSFDALHIRYKVKGNKANAELISVDRNVVEWPLVELATPPCESLYELGWWSSALLTLLNDTLKDQDYGNHIMPFGVNPYEDVSDITQLDSFPTCGEHHHIKLVENTNMTSEDRVFFSNFYHLVRFFTPYLIFLSACSPFASGRIWGRFRPEDLDLPFPGCLRSIRIIYNKKHLCNFQEGEYMPYLEQGWVDKRYFIDEFKKQSNSYRTDTHFLDIDPHSDENRTTEIRFFDSQPSVARRVGLAALLQMLAKKALKLTEKDDEGLLETVKQSNTNLHTLKKMACVGGGWFRPPRGPIPREFSNNKKIKHSKVEKHIFSDLVLEMLYLIREELKESELIYSHFLDPIRNSVYGLSGNGISPAQYWLFMYIKLDQDMDKLVEKILKSTEKAGNIWYDPISFEPIISNDVLLGYDKR